MISKVKRLLRILFDRKKVALIREDELLSQKLLTGKLLCNQLRNTEVTRFQEAEFSVFSQWGDDGLIQYLIQRIPIKNEFFVEFGVENYTESNTRFLLLNNNWSGFVMDGSRENVSYIQNDYTVSVLHDLRAGQLFVTAENINSVLTEEGIKGEIGLLHIDIDGNDYHVWKAIQVIAPVIVIVEYNSAFGADRSLTVPYDPDFFRTKAHHSNLFFGASLSALCDLAEEKGYDFVGSNSHGNNAFFVKKTHSLYISNLIVSPEEGYRAAKFREHRNSAGELTCKPWQEMLHEIKGMTVLNTKTGKTEPF